MELYLASALLVLGLIVLLGSIDDIIVDILTWWKVPQPRFKPLSRDVLPADDAKPEIAIFVANWHEADVLGPMVERNLANFTYGPVKFVLGVYPNDTDTVTVAMALAERFPGAVEVVVNRRNGPTSKGQMLNEMFARVFQKPEVAPDLVIMHDSEDVIAPKSFDVYAIESRDHAMIQIPIFSLDSRERSLVAATYMEEFAERHTGEMLLREELGAFVPSAGVGTCLRKDLILHFIAERGHVLQPGSVTEDYVLGAEAHAAGFSTAFASYRDVTKPESPIVATFEYFPKAFGASLRQRTRWTFGIGFESARRLGWFGSAWNRFFLYRDRKGAVANFLPLFSLLLLLACLFVRPDFSAFAAWQKTLLLGILGANSLSIVLRVVQKSRALREIYGSYDVLGLLARWPVALLINALAAARAWRSFIVESGLASKPIAWAKTQHELPATFNLAGARLALNRNLAGGQVRTRTPLSNRVGGVVAFACLALLVAGGLRIYEPLMAPVAEQVAGVLTPETIDQEELRIVEGVQLGAGFHADGAGAPLQTASPSTAADPRVQAERLRQTAASLAEFSLNSSQSRDQEFMTAALPAPVASQADVDVALAGETGDLLEDSEDKVEAVSVQVAWDDPVTRAALHATAQSLAELSLQDTARTDDVLLGRAQPVGIGDVAALLRDEEDEAPGDEETGPAIVALETRESVMSAAGAALADQAKRDAGILAQAVPSAVAVFADADEAPVEAVETREGVMSAAGAALADAAKRETDLLARAVPPAVTAAADTMRIAAGKDAAAPDEAGLAPTAAYVRDTIADDAKRSLAAAERRQAAVEMQAVLPALTGKGSPVKLGKADAKRDKSPDRNVVSGKERSKVAKVRSKAKAKAVRRKIAKSKTPSRKVAVQASAPVPAAKRASTFLRRGCQGSGCGGPSPPLGKLSKATSLWADPS